MAFNLARSNAFAFQHVYKTVKAYVGKFQVDRAVSRAGGYFYYAGGLGALAAGFREKLPAKALRMDGYWHCYAADQIAHLGRFAVYRKYIRQSVLPTAMKIHQYVRVGRFAVYGSGKLMGYAPAFITRENAVQINRIKRAPALHAAHCRRVHGGYYLYRALYGRILYKMTYKPLRNVNAAHLVAVYAGGECYMRFSAAECVYIILGIYPVFFYGDCFHASSCQIALSTSITMPITRYTAARAAKPCFALRLSVSACSAVSSKSSSVLCRGAFSPMRGFLRFSAGDLR